MDKKLPKDAFPFRPQRIHFDEAWKEIAFNQLDKVPVTQV
jgi:hypothetical protein